MITIDSVVGMPDEGGSCTVIQLVVRKNPVLVFGSGLHAAVLDGYLSSRGIPFAFTFDEEFKAFGIEQKVPHRSGRNYELVGAGQALVNVRNKEVELFGSSLGYEIGINEEHLRDVASRCIDWRFEKTDRY